jgi:hypothetical protein
MERKRLGPIVVTLETGSRREIEMEMLPLLLAVVLVALLGAAAGSFGVDSRMLERSGLDVRS